MVRKTSLDPTAGERARAIQAHPETPQLVLDPTDRRYGTPQPDELGRFAGEPTIADPTDPEYGEPAA